MFSMQANNASKKVQSSTNNALTQQTGKSADSVSEKIEPLNRWCLLDPVKAFDIIMISEKSELPGIRSIIEKKYSNQVDPDMDDEELAKCLTNGALERWRDKILSEVPTTEKELLKKLTGTSGHQR